MTSSDAYLHLADGPFSRLDLREKILKRLAVDRLHVIIDSCHSYFLVNARGERVRIAEDEESLERFPHAGFLLSTSAKKEVHEWSGYQAGVFSYQVLGALKGAADVDGDGIVSYGEVQAYVMAANSGVKNAAARVLPYVRRPVVRGQSLLDLRGAPRERRVEIPAALGGHLFVVDSSGTRVLDANKPRGLRLRIVVPRLPGVYLHSGGDVFAATRLEDGSSVFARPVEAVQLASKGTVEDEFRRNLFVQPLTVDFVAGVDAAVGAGLAPVIERRVRAPAWNEDPITWALLGSGAASAIFGAVSTGVFADYRDRYRRRPVTDEHEAHRSNAETWRALMIGGYATGGALLVAGTIRALITNEASVDREGLTVTPNGAGLVAHLSF